MKKLLVLISLILMVSPAVAGRPKLRGPNNPELRRIIQAKARHRHVGRNGCCRSYRPHRYNNRTYRARRHNRLRIGTVRRTNSVSRPRIYNRHHRKTAKISPATPKQTRSTTTRAKIVTKRKAKVRRYVYKRDGRK